MPAATSASGRDSSFNLAPIETPGGQEVVIRGGPSRLAISPAIRVHKDAILRNNAEVLGSDAAILNQVGKFSRCHADEC